MQNSSSAYRGGVPVSCQSSFAPESFATSAQRLISLVTNLPNASPVSVGVSEPMLIQASFSSGVQRTLIGSFGITPVAGPEPQLRESLAQGQAARARWAWAQTGTE